MPPFSKSKKRCTIWNERYCVQTVRFFILICKHLHNEGGLLHGTSDGILSARRNTQRLREEFLIDDLFRADDIKLVYSHIDRIITGSAVPVKGTLALTAGEELRAQYFLERRELGVINIGGIEFPITWTADSDTIKIVPQDNKMVTIDVDEKNPEEVTYTLTATLSNAAGETVSVSFAHKVPAAMILEGMSYEEIVAAAYSLEAGLALEDTQRLYGTVTKIDTPWSDEYKNITVTIQVGELADQPIQCYRLTGEGAENLQVGDAITVEGILKNYKGTIEFDKGCVLVGYGEIVSQKAIVDAAYALESGVAMTAPTALVGEVVSIDSAWSDEYQNITVTIVCDGLTEQPIQCYRLSGEGAQALEVGSVVGVYGTIKNYKGTVEFDKGCVTVPADSVASVRLAVSAYALEAGLSMNDASTMTGVITSIDTAWSDEYKNITVTIVPGGLTDYAVQCYRLSGEGAETLAVGDTITVSGTIKNYKGTIEFDKGCTLDAVVKAE